jgi:NAD(P)-dependent dehydrogenase (short-subunit alcohol dehydrogenase family)
VEEDAVSVSGARVVVTGGASGIGEAVARRFLDEGALVAVLDLQRPGGHLGLALPCDVSDEAALKTALSTVTDELGGIDIAVLNAGVGGYAPLVSMATEEWDRVLNINLRGTFLCLREVAGVMVEGGNGGAVVVTSSISASLTERGMGHYSVSKAAVNQLVRVAARELGGFGIRVNAVAPGTTDTPLFTPTRGLPDYWERLVDRTPLGGIGTPEQIARVVTALVELDWVTGQVVAADGGVSLWSPIDPTDSMG